ncbi:MAG: hypothetical protein LIP01_08390 [Tannerellaceae bacterium]|nr:hypothetical protein [Tannerellaceae bacterium]
MAKKIDWKLIGGGLLMQFLLALAILYVPFVGNLFEWIGKGFYQTNGFYTCRP